MHFKRRHDLPAVFLEGEPRPTPHKSSRSGCGAPFPAAERRRREHDGRGLAPICPLQDELPLMHHDFVFGDRLVITYREDELRYPKDYLKARIAERARQFEEETGEKPTKAMLEAFEAGIRGELRRKLLPGTRLVDVVWEFSTQEVRVFSRSKGPVERLQVLFERTFGVKIHQATYGQRAYRHDLNLRSRGMLENLEASPAFEPIHFQTQTLDA